MSVPSWARVGAKVICITTEVLSHQKAHSHRLLSLSLLEVGRIYTVTDIGRAPGSGRPCLWLAEVHCTWIWKSIGRDAGFAVSRFRPVHTLRGDVRAIKSMLRELPAETRLDRLLEALDE